MNVFSYEKAIELYYSKIELQNADIGELFNIKSSVAIASRKREVLKEMAKEKRPRYSAWGVNTEVAFK